MTQSAHAGLVALPEAIAVESLLFELAGERFALPLTDAVEIVRAVAVRKLPGAPSITLGIIDVRGTIVPVLDVRRRFGLPAKSIELPDQFIIAHAGPRTVALHVDRSLGLMQLSMVPLERAGNLPKASARVAGVAATREGLVLLHDLATFLSQAEAASLDAALDAESTTG